MVRGNKLCPYCNRYIRETDKYCPFCGKKQIIEDESTFKTKTSEPKIELKQPEIKNEIIEEKIIEPTEKIAKRDESKIPDNIMKQLEKRAELKIINNKLKEIREQIESLALKLTGDDIDDIEKQIKQLSNQVNELKSRKKEIESELVELPFEEIKNKQRDYESRIAKLQNAFSLGKVSSSAYNTLRAEYEQKLAELEQKYQEQKAKISIWIENLRNEKDKLINELEILKARHVAGEFSDTEYVNEREKLETRIKKLENDIKILNDFI